MSQPKHQYCMTVLGSAIYRTADAGDLEGAIAQFDAMSFTEDVESFDEHERTIEVYVPELREWVVVAGRTAPAGHGPQPVTHKPRPAHPDADAARAFIADYLAGTPRYQEARAELLAGIRATDAARGAVNLLADAIYKADPERQPFECWVFGILEDDAWRTYKRECDRHAEAWERASRAYDRALDAIMPARSDALPVYYPGITARLDEAAAKE